MEQFMTDPCVFRLIREGKLVLILTVHVDDMAVAGTRIEVNKLRVTLNKDFETNDLGELSFSTGCTITQDTEKGLTSISQKTSIETLARRFDVTTTSPYPASPCANLGARVEGESGGTWPDKEAIGGLMWLVVMSRPDITNAKIVTLSTTEAEYVALGDGVKEALFVKGVPSFIIPFISDNFFKVFVDNDGEISLANNPLSSARTKHIDVRFHLIRELTRSKTISVEYVPTKKQRAEILTKALTGSIFKEHRDFLMNLHG
ncbi:unnamed protein product [Ascophyllum nodosum]